MLNTHNPAKADWTGHATNYCQKIKKLTMIRYQLDLASDAGRAFAVSVAFGVFTVALFLLLLLVETGVLSPGLHLQLLLILMTLGAYLLAWRINPRHATYKSELSELLVEYDPIDTEQYRRLQQCVKNKASLDRRSLARWLNAERCAVLAMSEPIKVLPAEANDFLSKKV